VGGGEAGGRRVRVMIRSHVLSGDACATFLV
jgi:hypothetical protein